MHSVSFVSVQYIYGGGNSSTDISKWEGTYLKKGGGEMTQNARNARAQSHIGVWSTRCLLSYRISGGDQWDDVP